MHRAEKHGHAIDLSEEIRTPNQVTEASIGELLFAVVALASKHGIDPEFALRARARRLEGELRK